MTAQQAIQSLKNEINATLFFFIEMDVKIYGYITMETVSAFDTQKTTFPKVLKSFIK